MVLLRLSIATEHQFPAVGGWKVYVEHLNARKLLQHRTGSKSRRQDAQARSQTHVQTVGQESHKNVGFNPMFQPVENRSQTQIILEVFERRFDLRQLNIELPQPGRVLAA